MNARGPATLWRVSALGLALGLACGVHVTARAQHTPDPYNIVGEYNSQYEPYMFATNPNMPGVLPNQAYMERYNGNRNANNFQQFLQDGGEGAFEAGRNALIRQTGPGRSYMRSYRQFDQEFQRTYRPNEEADKEYYSAQQQRSDKYFQAMREKDPRKRAELLREYKLENMQAARDLSGGRGVLDRERDAGRDRRSPAPLAPPADDRVTGRRTTGAAPAMRGTGRGLAPLPTPLPRSRSGNTAVPSRSASARGGSAPDRASSLSPSSVLDRSERLDLAPRPTPSTAPTR